jgi:hypothetical protein
VPRRLFVDRAREQLEQLGIRRRRQRSERLLCGTDQPEQQALLIERGEVLDDVTAPLARRTAPAPHTRYVGHDG